MAGNIDQRQLLNPPESQWSTWCWPTLPSASTNATSRSWRSTLCPSAPLNTDVAQEVEYASSIRMADHVVNPDSESPKGTTDEMTAQERMHTLNGHRRLHMTDALHPCNAGSAHASCVWAAFGALEVHSWQLYVPRIRHALRGRRVVYITCMCADHLPTISALSIPALYYILTLTVVYLMTVVLRMYISRMHLCVAGVMFSRRSKDLAACVDSYSPDDAVQPGWGVWVCDVSIQHLVCLTAIVSLSPKHDHMVNADAPNPVCYCCGRQRVLFERRRHLHWRS